MPPIQYTFRRYEEKYIMTEAQYDRLAETMRAYMREDSYGKSTIRNIYYDTNDYELIRRSLERPIYKEKFRVRSYGDIKEDGEVFIEIKKKYDGIVYKRRICGNHRSVRAFIEEGKSLGGNEQIEREIRWFLRQYEPEPKMYIAYERVALYGKDDNEFRMTFDRNIRYRLDRLDLMEDDDGTVVLPQGTVLMEVKTLAAIPRWLIGFLGEEKLYPISYSKYGGCYTRELAKPRETEERICLTA